MESASMFGAMLGGAAGSIIPGVGTMVGALVGGTVGSVVDVFTSHHKQKKQQQALAAEQAKQAKLLHEKLKADTAELYSSVQSAVSTTGGAMGAVY